LSEKERKVTQDGSGGRLSRGDFLKLGGVGVAGMAVLGAAGCGGSSAQGSGGESKSGGGQTYSFRLADDQPQDYPTVIGDKKFASLVQKRTGGRIKIKVFPNAQLGAETDVAHQVQAGSIEFARINASPLAEFDKDLGVFSLPYIFDSSEHMWRFLNSKTGEALLDSLQSARMQGLAYYDSGARSFYTRKGIIVRSPKDMHGLKIRVQQSKINTQLMNALGASATPMDYGEVYTALQNGVVDGAENNWPSYYTSKHYEVAPNYTLDEHTRIPEVLLISKATWDKLSKQDQKIIKKAARDSVAVQRKSWDALVQKSKSKVRAAGNNIIHVNRKPWKDAVKPMISRYQGEYGKYLKVINSLA